MNASKWLLVLATFIPFGYGFCQDFSSQLNQIIQASNDRDIGISILDLKSGKPIYSKNAYDYFVPASNMKILTSVASLYMLGPEFQFKTQVLADKKLIDNQTLKGDYYLSFSGDPTLTVDQLDDLIKQSDIKTITGNIYIVDPYSGVTVPAGATSDDLMWGYASPVNGFILNGNQFSVTVTPSNTIGQPATLDVNDNFIHNLESEVVTQAYANCPASIDINYTSHTKLEGCVRASNKPYKFKLSIQDSRQYLRNVLAQVFTENGITFNGQIKYIHQAPQGLDSLSAHSSQELQDILKYALKNSDNLYMNSILKKMGEEYSEGAGGNFANGINALVSTINSHTNLSLNSKDFADGAGLSIYDKLQPSQISHVLFNVYNNQELASVYEPLLPIACTDGTLWKRMCSQDIKDNAFAKTGSMGRSGVSSLSGVVTTFKNHRIVYSILINQSADIHKARQMQNKIVQAIYSQL